MDNRIPIVLRRDDYSRDISNPEEVIASAVDDARRRDYCQCLIGPRSLESSYEVHYSH